MSAFEFRSLLPSASLACRRSSETAAKDFIFIKDTSLKYILVNPSMANFLELHADSIVGRTDEQLFGREAAEHLRKVDDRVLRGEIIEEEHTRPSKKFQRLFSMSGRPCATLR